MKYKSYNEKGSDRRQRKAARRSVFAFNAEQHTSRSKQERRAEKAKAEAAKA